MLVLERKINESILIGENIRIFIVALDGNRVKIGIQAPPDVIILRDELVDREPSTGRGARREVRR
jgi:carbon storage regulator